MERMIKRTILLSVFLLFFISYLTQAQSFELLSAQQAFQAQQYHRVISITENLLKRDSLNLPAYRLLASSQLAQQHPVSAEKTASSGLRYFPGQPDLQWIKAESLLQRGLADDALPLYEQLLNSDTSFSEEVIRQRIGIIYQTKGGRYYQEDKLDLAEKNLKKSKQFLPDSLASYSNLALVYMKQEDWEKALEVIDEGRSRFSQNSKLMQMRASVLFQTQNYDGVLEEYEKLYNKDPGNLDNALPYAQLLMARGENEKASEIYEQLSEDQPGERRIYESLIDYYGNRQNLNAKRQALRKMREQFPHDISLVKRIAQTYEQEGKWGNARAVYDTVRVMEGESKWLAISVAETYLKEDSLNAADVVYRRALNDAPEDPELLRLRGGLQERREQWGSAEDTYTQLVAVSDSSYGYAQLGKMQFNIDKTDRAYSNFNKAIEKGSTDPETYHLLSKIYVGRNEREEAFQYGVRALRRALQNVQELQNALTGKLEGNNNLLAMQGTEIEAKTLERNNKLAIDIFHFITSSFTEKKVMPLMQTLQKDYPQSGRLLMMIGSYYLEEEMTQDGITLIQKSVEFSPNLEEAHKILGEYYSETNQKVKAIQAYERALSAAPQDEGAYMQLIELYRGIGKLNQLCNRWMALYRANPNNQVLKESLIAALHKAERYEEATEIIAGK